MPPEIRPKLPLWRRAARPAAAQDAEPASLLPGWQAQWSALSPGDRGVGLLRGIGVLILAGMPVFLFLYPQGNRNSPWPGARFVWTVIIALLPLAIVAMGFYPWRRICPLAFFGRMGEWIGWPDPPGTRESERRRLRVPKWLTRSYPAVTWSFLAAMLALRLLLTNSNAAALAVSLIGLMVLAMLVSFRYTGKTWCCFLCPVSTIELIYTDGDKPNYRENSMCHPCTGCKTVPSGGLCPDINQENDYWQELKLPARAFSYYALPGLILGFYTWYFLHFPYYWHERQGQIIRGRPVPVQQPGTVYDWGYYFSGDWTADPRPWTHWLEPGFGFHGWPAIPTILAAPLTLILFSALSYLIFKGIEVAWLKRVRRRGVADGHALEAVRHPLLVSAGFVSFCLFYVFAGAPTLDQLPFGLYRLFQFGVVVFATSVLNTRLRRSRTRHLQYDQARKWVRKWPFPEELPPTDLDEAYTKYTLRMQFSQDRVRIFKEAVRHLLADSLVSVSELDLLDRLAQDLGVSEADQQRIVRELSKEAPEFFDPKYQGNLRDRLRLIGYRAELERVLSENSGGLPDAAELAELQARYRVQPAEHDEVMKELRDPRGPRAEHLRREVEELQALRCDCGVLAAHPDPGLRFLLHELELAFQEGRDHVLQMADLYGPAGELDRVRAVLRQPDGDGAAREQVADWLRRHLPAELAGEVVDAVCAAEPPADLGTGPTALAQVLLRLTGHSSVGLRAAAVYSLRLVWERASPDPAEDRTGCAEAARACAQQALHDPQPLVREAAVAALAPALSPEEWTASLRDASAGVRHAAVQRIPRLLSSELQALVAQARGDSDAAVRAATVVCDSGEPWRATGHRLPRLTTVEKMISLRTVPLLAHLQTETVHALAERAGEELFEAGEVLCHEGEIGDSVYLLIEGRTEVVKQQGEQEIRLGINGPGECVGEMAVLDPAPRFATVRALDTPVRVLSVEGEEFRRLLGGDAMTALSVMRLMIQRRRQGLQGVDS